MRQAQMSIHFGSVENLKPNIIKLMHRKIDMYRKFIHPINTVKLYIFSNNTINISTVNIESTINKFIRVKLISNQSKFVGNHASQMLHRCWSTDAQSSLLGTPILCALIVCIRNTGNVITAYGFNTAFSPWPSSNMSACDDFYRRRGSYRP